MKNAILVFGLFTLALLLSSCSDKNVLYKEFEKIEDLEWKKDDAKTFTISIDDNRKPKELILSFRYATGYRYDKVFMTVTEIDPQGARTRRDVDFAIRDANREFIGDISGDIGDIEYVIDANKMFPTHGNYTYIIEQAMPSNIQTLHYAMEVGLILREEKDK